MASPQTTILTLSLAATGSVVFALSSRHASFHIAWPETGTPVGTWSIATSSDAATVKDWVTLDPDTFYPEWTNPTGGADSTTIELDTCELFAKVTYTKGSGGTDAEATITCVEKE